MRRAALLWVVWGCTGTKETPPETTDTQKPPPTTTWEEPPPYDPAVETTENPDGTFSTLVQATDAEVFTYVSLSAGGIRVGNPTTTDPPAETWEFAYRRDEIRINGGVTGSGGVEASILEGISFEAIAWAPVAGYTTDEPDTDGDYRADGPFSGWFAYDINTHTLSPADQTYVVRSPQGTWRLRMDDYYSPDNNSGWPSFTWAPLTDPGPLTLDADDSGNEALRIDASAGPVWVALAEQMALLPPSPSDSDDWDLSFDATTIATNGGISGLGARSAAMLPVPFEEVTEMPPSASFIEDAPDDDADGVPEYAVTGVYDIDSITYAVTPHPDTTFVVLRPDTSADKFAVVGYTHPDTGAPGYPLLRTAVLQEAPEETSTLP